MPKPFALCPAVMRAARQIDQKRTHEASAHACAGSDCVVCSWRNNDLADIAAIIDRETKFPNLLELLQQLDDLRREIEAALKTKTGHPLAHYYLDGEHSRLHAITVSITAFTGIRKLLSQMTPPLASPELPAPQTRSAFVLQPLSLPKEAHSACGRCGAGAIMALESNGETAYLCYLHTIGAVVTEELAARTQ